VSTGWNLCGPTTGSGVLVDGIPNEMHTRSRIRSRGTAGNTGCLSGVFDWNVHTVLKFVQLVERGHGCMKRACDFLFQL
jgi:hypothetical protein